MLGYHINHENQYLVFFFNLNPENHTPINFNPWEVYPETGILSLYALSDNLFFPLVIINFSPYKKLYFVLWRNEFSSEGFHMNLEVAEMKAILLSSNIAPVEL